MPRVSMCMFAGIASLLVGQAIPEPGPAWITSGTALSILGAVCWWVLKDNRESRDAFGKCLERIVESQAVALRETCDRHERWEAQRHADSERLDSLLQQIIANCPAARVKP